MKNAIFWNVALAETSIYVKLTWRHIPEDGILHSGRVVNLYNPLLVSRLFACTRTAPCCKSLIMTIISVNMDLRKWLFFNADRPSSMACDHSELINSEILISYTVGRAPWTDDQPLAGPLPTQDNTNIE
jgi:hypothetical protein